MPARDVGELFNDLLEQHPEDREAYLRQACGDDENLYSRISSLLVLHDQLGSFMQVPVVEPARGTQEVDPGNFHSVAEKLSAERFSPGQLLGDRYRMEALLGRGGMGEVWRTYDLKLRVDVALKCLHKNLFSTEQGLELLRHEVRSARNVMSPHVCRIFDLVAADGQELVSMEYIDGHTLQDLLRERAPLELREAGEIASQLLAGLEAIHEADLVHRDVKPANVMITRAGRVVLMDFGLAKGLTDLKEGSIAGTPAYMAPEQARGAALDARADIFAAGVILAEMIGSKDQQSREELWAGVRESPAKIPEGPWEDVLRKATAWDPNGRFATAREMARALEEVTLGAEGIEERSPYPGLNSFTEENAEYFFGREAEVEEVWHKLQRLHLLAIIGLSGIGKSSFLRAGLMTAAPQGWRCVVSTPGASPFQALAQSMVPETGRDDETVGRLLRFEEPGVALDLVSRWRRRHGEALLILDQFEELFTLNPPEVQTRFTALLAQLAIEADVHVLLSMRDDFLFRCHEFATLKPIFSDLTPLGTLTGNALRRALVQPALACGYRFEDDSLVDEMIEEVREERGALPLLAFAAASMWEHRDRATGTLTRRAYERIGGVGGALARHAEATMERVGAPRHPIVREIFRNLVTAQGTRAVRITDELLTLFEEREEATEVLRRLVEARLLTSFDAPGSENGDGEVGQRVEIIHESLLSAWPRLVRWQTQDAEGAQLHDQLRQAAQLWQERSQSDDLLWTGTAFKEFELWRERYEGGLTESERAFAEAMEHRDRRQRRRRRIGIVSSFVILLGILAIVSKLKLDADESAEKAQLTTRQTIARQFYEHAKDLLSGDEVFNYSKDNTLALGFATAGLEQTRHPDPGGNWPKGSRAEWNEANLRGMASWALWQGPTRFYSAPVRDIAVNQGACFSPDGKWLVSAGEQGDILLWPLDGSAPMPDFAPRQVPVLFGPGGTTLLTRTPSTDASVHSTISLLSFPDGAPIWSLPVDGELVHAEVSTQGDAFLTTSSMGGDDRVRLERWHADSGSRVELGRIHADSPSRLTASEDGRWMGWSRGPDVLLAQLDGLGLGETIRVGSHDREVSHVSLSSDGRLAASSDVQGMVRLWSTNRPGSAALTYHSPTPVLRLDLDLDRSRLLATLESTLLVFRLEGPLNAEPMSLRRRGTSFSPARHPTLDWLITGGGEQMYFYPMANIHPYIIGLWRFESGDKTRMIDVAPDGRHVLVREGSEVWLVNLTVPGFQKRLLFAETQHTIDCEVFDPDSRRLAIGSRGGGTKVVPLDGGDPIHLEGSPSHTSAVAFSPSGRLIATAAGWSMDSDRGLIKVFESGGESVTVLRPGLGSGGGAEPTGDKNLDTGQDYVTVLGRDLRSLDAGIDEITDLEFLSETVLLAAWIKSGLWVWDLESRTCRLLNDEAHHAFDVVLSVGRNYFVETTVRNTLLYDRASFATRELAFSNTPARWNITTAIAISSDDRFVVQGRKGGIVFVLHLDEEEPHKLIRHDNWVTDLWIDPRGRWILSTAFDGIARYWPVPRGRPLSSSTRPLEEYMELLQAQTNHRMAVDYDRPEGYRSEGSAFPGWETIPTWQDWASEEYFDDPPWRSYEDVLEEAEAADR